jgi:anti-sigma B factor antagonist/stage II sporulation protein AA (anti-sigma F factor antagonist)
MSGDLEIEVEEIDDKIILHLDGRLDAATTPVLEKRIHSLITSHRWILIDFLSVDYLSSAGLRLLLANAKKLKERNGALILFSITENVMEVIKLAGFEKILMIFDTEEEALQYKPHH